MRISIKKNKNFFIFLVINLLMITGFVLYSIDLIEKERSAMREEFDYFSEQFKISKDLNNNSIASERNDEDEKRIDNVIDVIEIKREKKETIKEEVADERLRQSYEDKLIEKEKKDNGISIEVIDKKRIEIERYFLSEVEPINGLYTPTIHLCLYENQNQIYPSYLYRTWSSLQYPGYLTGQEPEIELIRYLLLPEDNDNFQPNKSCYIKEIKTESDWQEITEKYSFYKNQFN